MKKLDFKKVMEDMIPMIDKDRECKTEREKFEYLKFSLRWMIDCADKEVIDGKIGNYYICDHWTSNFELVNQNRVREEE